METGYVDGYTGKSYRISGCPWWHIRFHFQQCGFSPWWGPLLLIVFWVALRVIK
jgi:hypothetical protein